jgi:polyisoprenoid-binding protein YceI
MRPDRGPQTHKTKEDRMTILSQPQTQTVWDLDKAHTLIEFTVKNMMLSSVTGRFTKFQGRIVGSLDDPTNAHVEVTIDAASIDTGNQRRDAHLRSADFLDVERYPTITFTSARIERTDKHDFRIWGALTIRDNTREVELEATINGVSTSLSSQDAVSLTVTGSLLRKEWGVKWNIALETGGVLIGNTVRFNIEVEAVKLAEG